jgi:nitrite reductase (cytochrome c-552)
MTNTQNQPSGESLAPLRARMIILIAVLGAVAAGVFVVTAVLVTMFEHKQEARTPFVRVVEVNEVSTDPAPWALNWPHQFDGYKATALGPDAGGSSAITQSKLDTQPWLKRLYAGYAFSIDYREARGHAYMLYDQTVTERVTKRQQAGACLHCHGSVTVMYRKLGLEAMGQPADEPALAASFNMPAMIRGFQEASRKPYHEMLGILQSMPDGTPGAPGAPGDAEAKGESVDMPVHHGAVGGAHPVSCIDCHDPATMALRVTRPGFMQGIADLAAGPEPVPHLPSIEQWRQGDRSRPYDPNKLASRQEMRSFACGQCHVEYYCANKMTLTFPWANGLKVEQIEQYWDQKEFPDGGGKFYDYAHGETGAHVYKAQHPEFELWSQGIHARSGVSCADCHMPYERVGAMKVSSHNVRSPLMNVNRSCQMCHRDSEQVLVEKVRTIQGRTVALMDRAASAMTEMLDAILDAKAAGATEQQLSPLFELQKKAMWRLDYISSENSKGFHADQEAARILGESIDYSRQAQALAISLRAPAPPKVDHPVQPVQGVTPNTPPAPEPAAPAPKQ